MIRIIFSPVVALVSFSIGIFFTPVPYVESFTLIKEVNFDSPCFSAVYSSSRNKRVVFWSCTKNPALGVDEWKSSVITHYQIVEQSGNRYLGIFHTDRSSGYCAIRVDRRRETSICSDSLPDVLELEKQLASKRLLVEPN